MQKTSIKLVFFSVIDRIFYVTEKNYVILVTMFEKID